MASKQELIDYVADRTELSKVNAAKAIKYLTTFKYIKTESLNSAVLCFII